MLATFFLLYGFVSDLKNLNPGIYDKAESIISVVITTVSAEGQVDRVSSLENFYLTEKSSVPEIPPFIIPKKDDEEQDIEE